MHCTMCKLSQLSCSEPASKSFQAIITAMHDESSPCPRHSFALRVDSSLGLYVQVRPYQMAIASSDPYVRVYDRRMLATGTCPAHCLGGFIRGCVYNRF